MKKRKAAAIAAGTLAAALSIGAGAWAGLRYWTGEDFTPSGEERALRNNQVLFQQEPDPQATQSQNDGQDNARWEKDPQSENNESPQLDQNGNFLFQTDNSRLPGTTGGILDENGQLVEDGRLPENIFTPGGGEGTGIGGGAGGTTGEPTEPTEGPSFSDPTPVKKDPPKDVFDEDKDFDDQDFRPVYGWDLMRYGYICQDFSSPYRVYAGRKYTEQDIFASLITCFLDDEYLRRPIKEYGTYIRFDGVSLDGGETWITEFPIDLPADMATDQPMKIRVSYRFSKKSAWLPAADEEPFDIDYYVAPSRVMVLSTENPGDPIAEKYILNYDDQYPDRGTVLNLLEMQLDVLKEDSGDYLEVFGKPLERFFKGWQENGKPVSWQYTVTGGRHLLTPAGFTDVLPEGYSGAAQIYAVNEDFEQDPEGSSTYFQTLVSAPVVDNKLTVPEYAQAIFLNRAEPVGVLELPASLLLIPDLSGKGLTVTDAYVVAEGNPVFSSKDGLLLSADGKTIRGVPTSITSLDVPETIEAVRPLRGNALRELHLQSGNTRLRYDNMPGITVYLPKEQVNDFCRRDAAEIEQYNITVRTEETVYEIQLPYLVDGEGAVCRLLRDEAQILELPQVKDLTLRTGAFAGASVATTLTVPEQVKTITLEKDCLMGSNIHLILCGNVTQRDQVRAQLAECGVENITASILTTTAEGYVYAELGENQNRLVSVPEELDAFTGVPGVTLTEIGNGAFENRTQLRWVSLPESVKTVEQNAFAGCTALEGMLIRSTDTITLQEGMVEGCTSLRFIASNAHSATMPTYLGTNLTYTGYCLAQSIGYPSLGTNVAMVWGENPDSDHYSIYVDANGNRLLYGMDGENQYTRLMNCGTSTGGRVILPGTTVEIVFNAFKNLNSEGLTLNWEDLKQLRNIGQAAFLNSGLSGSVKLGALESVNLGSNAFEGCHITDIEASQLHFGDYVFADCKELKTIETTIVSWVNNNGEVDPALLPAGLAGNCEKLEKIILHNKEPMGLGMYSPGLAFNLVSADDPANLLRVEKGLEKDYAEAWLYSFGGYNSREEMQLKFWDYSDLELEDIAARQWEWDTQRKIYRLIEGLDPSEIPDPGAGFQIEFDPMTWGNKLTAVPANLTSLRLVGENVGMAVTDTVDYVGTGAFSGCTGLTEVSFPYRKFGWYIQYVSGIYSDAFSTGGQGEILLNFEAEFPPALVPDETGTFVFRSDGGRVRVQVPQGCEETYISTWLDNLGCTREELLVLMGWAEAKPRFNCETLDGRNGIRLNGAPADVEDITLDAETLGQEPGTRLLEINADAFENCDSLKRVVIPDTVDAITAKAFTCATESLTLDMTAWTKDKTPPTLILLDEEPFTFGLKRADAKLTIKVADEQTKQRFVEAWAPFFAGADSEDALTEKLTQAALAEALAERTELPQQERAAIAADARLEAQNLLRQATEQLETIITYYQPEEETNEPDTEQ